MSGPGLRYPPPAALAAVAVCSVALAACGSSPKPSSFSTPSGSGSGVTQAVKFAQCMRSNGVKNYPDPSSSGRPRSLDRIDPNAPAFVTAYGACRKDLAGGGIGPPAPSAAQLRVALAFARCVRSHGLPRFPDPLTTYGSGFTLGLGMYFPDNGTYQVESSAFRRAAKACGVQLPQLPQSQQIGGT